MIGRSRKPGEHFLAHYCLRVGVAALVLGALAFGLAGCGRNGAPEPPPQGSGGLGWALGPPSFAAAPPPPGEATSNAPASGAAAEATPAAKSGFDANGNPVAGRGQKKPFLLDPILQ